MVNHRLTFKRQYIVNNIMARLESVMTWCSKENVFTDDTSVTLSVLKVLGELMTAAAMIQRSAHVGAAV